MKVNRLLQQKIGKKYMRLACLYGVYRKKGWGLDYSENALLECYNYESKGGFIGEKNGFYAGKRAMDITVSDAIQEIKDGNFCKAEFYTPLRGWYWKKKLENVIATPLFAYSHNALLCCIFGVENFVLLSTKSATEKMSAGAIC